MKPTIAKLFIGACMMMGPTQAAQITLTGLGFGRTDVAMEVNGSPVSEYAIQIYLTKNSINFTAYCVDLFTSIGFATYDTTTGLPSTWAPNGQRAAWVFDTYETTVDTNEEGAALQLALWDIIHDSGDGLSAGSVRLGPSESALQVVADAMVTASLGQTSNNA